MPCKYAPDLHTALFQAEIDLFDSFVGFGQWVSGSGRENSPASSSANKWVLIFIKLLTFS